MKASFRWLRELCPQLPDDAATLAARLTSAGLEVEGAEAFGAASDACVLASVTSARPHPSRSGLRLVTVDRGGVEQEVICGAPNVPDPGGLVVLAPLGAQLPAKNITIEARSIGGVTSEGMLCSEAELGLSDDAEGLLVLSPGIAAPGTPLSKALPGSRDTVFEIGLTPNRPDGLGHVGLAREAAALFEVPFILGGADPLARTVEEDLGRHVTIAIEDGARCPHYAAAVLLDVRVARSPAEVRWRLAALGVRPISNVVDVTNLVMLEFGHPMHAFDLDQVRGRAIVVRRAREGEPLRTLDGIERKLTADDLVICDAEGPVALAGVMGGGNSEITPGTRRVLLECAYFDPPGVRRAARRHGLHTESSHRFERGVDWGDTRAAMARATSLVASLADATAVTPGRFVEATPLARRTVVLRHDRAAAVLGGTIERPLSHMTLARLGFACRASEPGMDVWEVPSFRPDVSREIDLVEEIGRVRGYDVLPADRPAVRASRDAGPVQALVRRARQAAVACGLSEAVTYAFVSARDLERVSAPPAAIALRNPLGEQHSVMRTSLLPGLLQALARAQRHGERDARLFTVAPIFLVGRSGQGAASEVEERPTLAAVMAGERTSFLSKPEPFDVWDAKGLARALVLRLLQREPEVAIAPANDRPAALHPRGAAWVEVEGKRVGSIGPLHPDVADAFEVERAVVVVELDLHALEAIGPRPLRFSPLPRFPSSTRDLAIVVEGRVPAGVVEEAVREAAGDLAERVTLFDRFVGGSVPAGRASLALHVVYRAPDRTLTDSEVDARHAQVLAAVEKRFGATLRS
jgi:phenylalanyl-tRNA synthetase beta chain